MAAHYNLNDIYFLNPISLNSPDGIDNIQTRDLEQFFRDQNLYESHDESVLREEVLGSLDQLVKKWVKNVARKYGYGGDFVEEANALIFTFGSYRLGVHGPGADIDTLCVAPRYCKRHGDFFGSEKHCLQYMLSESYGVTDLQPVPDAFVPVLSFKYHGISIDTLFAPLQMMNVPESIDLSSNNVLRGCDEQTVRSLNGCRVTDEILRLVKRPDVFRLALRAIKYWAERRGIYSNVLGFLGGVNQAILTAKACQLYPNAAASTIVLKTFTTMMNWPWPRAIHLKPVQKDDPLGMPLWDPAGNTRDAAAIMPVVTPAYPAMNSMYNVQWSTFDIMLEEFRRGASVCQRILLGDYQRGMPTAWAQLFEPLPFFTMHTFYVMVEVSANDSEDLRDWDGWVNSRMRKLVKVMEDQVCPRPLPKPLNSNEASEDGRARRFYFIGVDKRTKFLPRLETRVLPGNILDVNMITLPGAPPARKISLSTAVNSFIHEVTAWQTKREGMELKVKTMRRSDLPHWVLPQAPEPLALPPPLQPPDQHAVEQVQTGTAMPVSLPVNATAAHGNGTAHQPLEVAVPPPAKAALSAEADAGPGPGPRSAVGEAAEPKGSRKRPVPAPAAAPGSGTAAGNSAADSAADDADADAEGGGVESVGAPSKVQRTMPPAAKGNGAKHSPANGAARVKNATGGGLQPVAVEQPVGGSWPVAVQQPAWVACSLKRRVDQLTEPGVVGTAATTGSAPAGDTAVVQAGKLATAAAAAAQTRKRARAAAPGAAGVLPAATDITTTTTTAGITTTTAGIAGTASAAAAQQPREGSAPLDLKTEELSSANPVHANAHWESIQQQPTESAAAASGAQEFAEFKLRDAAAAAASGAVVANTPALSALEAADIHAAIHEAQLTSIIRRPSSAVNALKLLASSGGSGSGAQPSTAVKPSTGGSDTTLSAAANIAAAAAGNGLSATASGVPCPGSKIGSAVPVVGASGRKRQAVQSEVPSQAQSAAQGGAVQGGVLDASHDVHEREMGDWLGVDHALTLQPSAQGQGAAAAAGGATANEAAPQAAVTAGDTDVVMAEAAGVAAAGAVGGQQNVLVPRPGGCLQRGIASASATATAPASATATAVTTAAQVSPAGACPLENGTGHIHMQAPQQQQQQQRKRAAADSAAQDGDADGSASLSTSPPPAKRPAFRLNMK